jgi:threonylcarbamoyladenosine tRNA methylthiotransferase MtaB
MKIHFYTFGCKVNQYDTQSLKDKLEAEGHTSSDNAADADVAIINSCTVTAEADRQCRQVVRRMLRETALDKVIINGCYSRRARGELAEIFKRDPRVGVASTSGEILEILRPRHKQTAATPSDAVGRHSPEFSAAPLKNFLEKSRAYVKIQDGCDQFCSYCIVPTVRPVLASRPSGEVLAEIASLTTNGYPEIVLCGVRLGRYAPTKDYTLEHLIVDILSLGDDFRIRLSSIEIKEITPALIRLMKNSPLRICPHLHIPLQSGSDVILKKMNRPYTSAEYESKIFSIKKEFAAAGVALTLTTDVIIGFPSESDEDFNATRSLCERLGFSKLHIFPYSERPGTAASKMAHRRDAAYLRNLDARKKNLFALTARLEKTARAASESSAHRAVALGRGWALTEDYQYYKTDKPLPDGIFDFDPARIS